MGIEVVEYSDAWPAKFQRVAEALSETLRAVAVIAIEHVGSTSVPGLAAKPILDVDVIVSRPRVLEAVRALEAAGYIHLGDLGLTDREAFEAPDQDPTRNVYVGVEDTLHVRNHLAVRKTLRSDAGLRERYAAVKRELAHEPDMDIIRYVSGKSAVLQDILAASDLTPREKQQVYELNTRARSTTAQQEHGPAAPRPEWDDTEMVDTGPHSDPCPRAGPTEQWFPG